MSLGKGGGYLYSWVKTRCVEFGGNYTNQPTNRWPRPKAIHFSCAWASCLWGELSVIHLNDVEVQ